MSTVAFGAIDIFMGVSEQHSECRTFTSVYFYIAGSLLLLNYFFHIAYTVKQSSSSSSRFHFYSLLITFTYRWGGSF